jgi:hypothetical protein
MKVRIELLLSLGLSSAQFLGSQFGASSFQKIRPGNEWGNADDYLRMTALDWSGDGTSDLVVTSYHYSTGPDETEVSSVKLNYQGQPVVSNTLSGFTASIPAANDFGYSISAASNAGNRLFIGDGKNDAAYVLWLTTSGTTSSHQKISLGTGGLSQVILPSNFGRLVCAMENWNFGGNLAVGNDVEGVFFLSLDTRGYVLGTPTFFNVSGG